MYQKERIDSILAILKEYNYVTVKYLEKALHYSTATINRDLNIMEGQKLIQRTYGGVELIKGSHVPLEFRYHKMRPEKKLIAKEASKYVKNGDTIFIDGSTTCQFIGEYIINKKNITVITNNIALVTYLAEHNVKVICLGGTITEPPYILGGVDTVTSAASYTADKMFFSAASFTRDGKIGSSDLYHLAIKKMADNSKEVFFLADHDKLDRSFNRVLCDASGVDYIISDLRFSDDIIAKFSDTKFIEVATV